MMAIHGTITQNTNTYSRPKMMMKDPLHSDAYPLPRTIRHDSIFAKKRKSSLSLLLKDTIPPLDKSAYAMAMKAKAVNQDEDEPAAVTVGSNSECQNSAISSSIASSGSYSSVNSMNNNIFSVAAATATASINAAPNTTSEQRRRIFTQYWQNHPLPTPPIASLVREPKSPLIRHYPRTKTTTTIDCNASTSSTLATNPLSDSQQQHQQTTHSTSSTSKASLPVSPARRSIFGARQETTNLNLEIESELVGFLSRHKHMTVLSASYDRYEHVTSCTSSTSFSSSSNININTSTCDDRLRLRSYSCSDTSMALADTDVGTNSNKAPLISCLRRSNSEQGQRQRQNQQQDGNTTGTPLRHTVTFDSQVSIVSFEPTASYNMECYSEGSWADAFDH